MIKLIKSILTTWAMKLTVFMLLVLVLVGNGVRLDSEKGEDLIGFELDSSMKQIAVELLAAAGSEVQNIQVYEGASNIINAFAFPNNVIFVNSGLLKWSLLKTQSYGPATAVLAHEIAHRMKPSIYRDSLVASRNEERRSDYLAAWLLHTSKKGCELQVQLSAELLKINSTSGNYTHPSNIERYISAVKNCKALKETGKLPKDLYFEEETK